VIGRRCAGSGGGDEDDGRAEMGMILTSGECRR
jgi:hypothetical protein